jgi:hypothetical protein
VDLADTRAWFNEYLLVFAACGRGASDDLGALMDYYGVPLLLTTDAAAAALMTEADVLNAISGQIAGLRAAGYAGPRRSTPTRPQSMPRPRSTRPSSHDSAPTAAKSDGCA